MLNNQTAAFLRAMKLPAMAAEFLRQLETPSMDALGFDARVGMMVDAEWLSRENSRIQRLTKAANLRFSGASFADIDYRPARKLDTAYIARLSDFAWVKEAHNIILTGATGTGKTWLACAFGAEACRAGHSVAFYRVNRLLGDMAAAANDGNMGKLLAKLKKCDILILDDWGLNMLTPLEGRFLLEIFEERYGLGSSILSAQLPVAKWHSLFEDSTIADAVLDRLVHNAYRLELAGPSLRPSANKDLGRGAQGAQVQKTCTQSDSTACPDTVTAKDGDSDV
jgi:DNA replication protein DnaC